MRFGWLHVLAIVVGIVLISSQQPIPALAGCGALCAGLYPLTRGA